ncbi:MAG TPA: DNA primase [Clostridiales bacterium]|nr:DNA primase [Clostridiales bacterium]
MPISGDFLLELKYKNNIEDVVSSYVSLKRRGKNLVGLCPFHNEKTPSFTIYPDNGSFYCFGCGVGGDVITFIRQIENLDYIEAVRFLAARAGMPMPDQAIDNSDHKLKSRILEINRLAARFYYNFLMSEPGKPALNYLLNRGLTLKTIKKFGLGAAPNGWDELIKHLKSHGYTEDELVTADVAIRGRNNSVYDKFRNRIIFPIINLRGNVVAFGARVLPGEKGAKYINTSDTPVFKKSHNMFALNFAKNTGSESVILAEGYMDVIALHQAGFTNAVAALGTAFTEDQARLLSRYTKQVILTLDSDTAGKKATNRAIEILQTVGLQAKVLRIPDAKDPDEFIKKHGASRFEALLNGAVSDIEYKLFLAAEGLDLSTESGKLEYLKRVVDVLSDLDNPIARDLYAGKIAGKFEISKSTLLDTVEKQRKVRLKAQEKKQIRRIVSPQLIKNEVNPEKKLHMRAVRAEEALISILMAFPEYYEWIKEKIGPDQLVTDFSKRIFMVLIEMYDNGHAFDLALVGDRFTPQEMGYLAALQNRMIDSSNVKRELQDCIKVILEEKEKLKSFNAETMSTEEWAENMKRIAEKKQRGI